MTTTIITKNDLPIANTAVRIEDNYHLNWKRRHCIAILVILCVTSLTCIFFTSIRYFFVWVEREHVMCRCPYNFERDVIDMSIPFLLIAGIAIVNYFCHGRGDNRNHNFYGWVIINTLFHNFNWNLIDGYFGIHCNCYLSYILAAWGN